MATTIAELMALQKRANATVKKRSGGALSEEDKANMLKALTSVADGVSVQGAAEEHGVNQYALYAFVKGKKKLDLLAD
jgi:transposase-like protein